MKKWFENENFTLAAIPVAAFILAFAFESGVADAYGYSYALISIDLRVMIYSIAMVTLFAFPLLVYWRFMFSLVSSHKGVDRMFGFPLCLFLPFLVLCYASGFDRQICIIAAVYGGLGCMISIVSVATKAFSHGWKNAITESAKSEGYKDIEAWRYSEGPIRTKDRVIADAVMLFVIVCMFGMVHGSGKAYSKIKNVYEVVSVDGNELAILTGYGDRLILGGVTGGRFNGKITIKTMSSDGLNDLQQVRIPNMLENERELPVRL